ncbi:hypothetical protein KKJ18_21060, partial [Xenorhabdus bovienii]|nr:hypothetical protein [Xenorhabdus bovienii]
EVIIVETQTAPVTAPPERMKYPLDTSPAIDKGTKTPIVPKENKSLFIYAKEIGEKLLEYFK